MKCVTDKMDLQTYRTSNEDAQHKVKSGRYALAPKKTWKMQGRCR